MTFKQEFNLMWSLKSLNLIPPEYYENEYNWCKILKTLQKAKKENLKRFKKIDQNIKRVLKVMKEKDPHLIHVKKMGVGI